MADWMFDTLSPATGDTMILTGTVFEVGNGASPLL